MNQSTRIRTVDDVLFVTSSAIKPGELHLHANLGDRVLVRSLDSLRKEWTIVNEQVMAMIDGTVAQTKPNAFGLEEVSVGLAFTATGKLAFIAEAGAEASITLTFKRREQSGSPNG